MTSDNVGEKARGENKFRFLEVETSYVSSPYPFVKNYNYTAHFTIQNIITRHFGQDQETRIQKYD